MRHPIITIYDLKHLTDMELEILDNALRHILASRDLTETECANIIASLQTVLTESELRTTIRRLPDFKECNSLLN